MLTERKNNITPGHSPPGIREAPQVRETNHIICKSSVIKNVIKYHVFIYSIHSLQKRIITTKTCESKNHKKQYTILMIAQQITAGLLARLLTHKTNKVLLKQQTHWLYK